MRGWRACEQDKAERKEERAKGEGQTRGVEGLKKDKHKRTRVRAGVARNSAFGGALQVI